MKNRIFADIIAEIINKSTMVLQGQPKWTFGKNTCNTYELFVSEFITPDGKSFPSWEVLQEVENDDELSVLFSRRLLWETARKTIEISNSTNTNMTLSLNMLPRFAESSEFISDVCSCLEQTGLQSKHLQFEISELQDLNENGCANLNTLHDEHGVLLAMGNFGTSQTNIPLLCKVHFDLIELARSMAEHVPEDDQTCRTIIGIQHMAHTLEMNICAKGIDTQDQFEFFEEIGTFKGQGSLIGNAMNMEELEDYVRHYGLHRGHD